jgi:hypothetical protein
MGLVPKQNLSELKSSVTEYSRLPKKRKISGLKSLIKNEIDRLQVLYTTLDTAMLDSPDKARRP